MKRSKTFLVFLLTILSLGFIVFVVIMQQQFNNPEFTDLPQNENAEETTASNDNKEIDDEKEEDKEEMTSSEEEDEKEKDEENEETVTTSTRTVTAETLNVRAGPNSDYEITGVLVLDQSVTVEDRGEEWVKVSTDDFSGYVNESFLSEE